MKFLEINRHTYACEVHQQQSLFPYLLMLHGFMGDQRVFDHLVDPLCDFCNPVTIDLLGHGQSSKPPEARHYREEQQLSDMGTFINHLNVDRLFLHGYSMGGRLALKTALAAPDRVNGLILESTNCGISNEQKRKERRQTDEQRAQEITADFGSFLKHWQQLPLFKSPIPDHRPLQKRYGTLQREQSPEALAASLRGFGTGSMDPCCDDSHKLNLPVLLVAGSADEKYQKINQQLVQRLPNAHFSSVRAGHRLHLDNPSDFIDKIKSFIYGCD